MKRIVFALLHSDGSYMLSRNFRLQRVGDLDWVLRNYEIGRVSLGIDELMVLDVSPRPVVNGDLLRHVERLTAECFVPVTVGGWLRSMDDVARCFAVGAEKVLMNTAFFDDLGFCREIAATYGNQALVASVDVVEGVSVRSPPAHRPFVGRQDLRAHVERMIEHGAGEILVQSVDRDGTGGGLDLSLVEVAACGSAPLIMMGGVGHSGHLTEGLRHPRVDAVATANLFNFIGDSLVAARRAARSAGVALPMWSSSDLERLRGILAPSHSGASGGPGDD